VRNPPNEQGGYASLYPPYVAMQFPTAGAPSNTATLTVSDEPPTITKSFSPATIQTNGNSILTLVIGNPNAHHDNR